MREFKYNVIDLISYVRDRPCLWDKTIENYKDRMERRSAWEEIFNNLEETYEEMTPEEKRITGDSIIRKWSNMRDSYMKSLRTRPGQNFRKKYMYAKNLKFLRKNAIEKGNDDFNISDNESSQSASTSTIQLSPTAPDTPSSTPEPFVEFPPTVFISTAGSLNAPYSQQKKKRKETDEKKKALLAELKKKSRNNTSTRSDEKETMLLSLLPYIKDMNETEMMDLHMDMLTSIRRIKDKRVQNPDTSAPLGSSTLNDVNSSQTTSTHNFKPAVIKINPQKTVNFTLPNSQKGGELILNKWTNIRDTFIKSLKTKMGRPKKKYLLYNHLEFLTKIIPESERHTEIVNARPVFMKQEEPDSGFSITTEIEPESSTSFTINNVTSVGSKNSAKENDFDDAKSNDFACEVSYGRKSSRVKRKSNRFIFVEDADSISSKKKTKKSSVNDDVSVNDQFSTIDFVEVDDNDPRIMNEDEAFFASLLPTIVKYNEDERLEFRIEVLGIMKKLKDKRTSTWMAE